MYAIKSIEFFLAMSWLRSFRIEAATDSDHKDNEIRQIDLIRNTLIYLN